MNKQTMSDMLCHLIDIFWSHAHNQQFPIVQRSTFDQRIDGNNCPWYLFLAMCAAGVNFSNHPKIHQEQDGVTLGDNFYSMARQAVHSDNDGQSISRIQTFCLLAIYDSYRGHGKQACENSSKYLGLSNVNVEVIL